METIFIAANNREADRVERILEDAGIAHSQQLGADESSGVCHLRTLFEVPKENADACRRLLTRQGLAHGIVDES